MSALLSIAAGLAVAPLFWSGTCEMRLDGEPDSPPVSVTYGWTESQQWIVIAFPEGTVFESGVYVIKRDPLNDFNLPEAETVKFIASVSGAVGESEMIGFEYFTYHKSENRVEVEVDFHRAQDGVNFENATLLCDVANAFPVDHAS